MDTSALFGLLGLAAAAAVVAGGFLFGWLRGPIIVVLAGVTLACTVLTGLLIYGGFTLSDRGGGTLLLAVVPVGLVAVAAGVTLSSVWASLPVRGVSPAQARAAAEAAMEEWQADMEADLQKREAQLASRWMMPGKRRALEAELRERRLLYATMEQASKQALAAQADGDR